MEYVRIRDERTGHHYTISAEAQEAEPNRYRLLKQAAVDGNGAPLAPKYRAALGGDTAATETTATTGDGDTTVTTVTAHTGKNTTTATTATEATKEA